MTNPADLIAFVRAVRRSILATSRREEKEDHYPDSSGYCARATARIYRLLSYRGEIHYKRSQFYDHYFLVFNGLHVLGHTRLGTRARGYTKRSRVLKKTP